MNVSSVGNAYAAPQTQAAQRTPEATEVSKGGRDNDGDSDDGGVKAAQAAPKPTVSLTGAKLGQLINVVA